LDIFLNYLRNKFDRQKRQIYHSTMNLMVAIALSGVICLTTTLWAQEQAIVILESRGIKAELVETPTYSGSFGASRTATDSYKGKKWLEVEFEFTCEEGVKGYVEELTFRAAIEAREFRDLDDTEGVPVVLVGEVIYLNVPAKKGGSKHYGSFYVHPFTIARFGEDRAFKFSGSKKTKANNNIRIEALIGGQPVPLNKDGTQRYVDLLEDEEGWVTQCKRITNNVLDKNHSPWALASMERYPLIKPRGGGGS
jgi:hypothetical protein